MENAINMLWELFVEGGSSKKEKEGKKKGRGKERKEREEKKREREGEERERERRRKGKRCFDGQNSSDQEVKSVYTMRVALQEVEILHTFVYFLSFKLFFWFAFGTTLCHVYGMFCGINWNMTHFAVSIETGL